MKKRILAAALAVALTVSLSGCGVFSLLSRGRKDAQEETAQTQEAAAEASDGEAEIEEEEVAEETVAAADGISFTITQCTFETEETFTDEEGDTFPYAYVEYPRYEIPQEMFDKYPEAAEALQEISDDLSLSGIDTLAGSAQMAQEAAEEDFPFYSSFYDSWLPSVLRADERAISIVYTKEAYYNGAHPSTWYESVFLDTKTGEVLPLDSVITDMKALPQAILEELETVSDDYEFSDSELDSIYTTIKDYVSEGYLVWGLDDTGLQVYFDAYDLMYYAFGPIFATISYDEYPELFDSDYLPVEGIAPVDERIRYIDGDVVKWTLDELSYHMPDYMDEEGPFFYIDCPDWEVPYLADGIFDTMTEPDVTLTEVNKYVPSEGYLDRAAWLDSQGLDMPENLLGEDHEFSGGEYWYYASNENSDYLSLEVYDNYSGTYVGTYDFTAYLDTPKEASYAWERMKIPYAELENGILYVELSAGGGSEDQPDGSFLVAVEADTGKLLWKSEKMIANGDNFIIYGDTIVCGYGFTGEDDYMYFVSKLSGAVLGKVKLKTAPYYFVPDIDYSTGQGILYVLTYDTVYTYAVSYG